jgi:hypothetical protein
MGGGRTLEEWQEIERPYDHFIDRIKADREGYEQWLDIAESASRENLPE